MGLRIVDANNALRSGNIFYAIFLNPRRLKNLKKSPPALASRADHAMDPGFVFLGWLYR